MASCWRRRADQGVDKLRLRKRGLPVHIADDPLSAVAMGTGVVLQELGYLEKLAKNSS